MRVLFLAGEDASWAGSRYRAWNLEPFLPGSTVVRWGYDVRPDYYGYDAVIFQKPYGQQTPQRMAAFLSLGEYLVQAGTKIYWDLCDPIWWWNDARWIEDFLSLCRGVVVSNEGLATDFRKSFGVKPVVIPDRMPYRKEMRIHAERERPVMVWYGYASNRGPSLTGITLCLSRLVFEGIPHIFRIIDDYPKAMAWEDGRAWSANVEYGKWDERRFASDLCGCDIAIIPPYPHPWGSMKSENKTAEAYWSGLPVSDGTDYYRLRDLLLKWRMRADEGQRNRSIAEERFDVQQSAAQWTQLLGAV
jgi:hypothetical protein